MSASTDAEILRVERHQSPADMALHRAAVALNSSLDLRTVLHTLAEVTLEATEASRASLLLAREGGYVPAVSLGQRTDERLWDAFREMGPVTLDALQRSLLADGTPVPLTDPASDPLFPSQWVERFGLESLVVVQLFTSGDPCGLLVVDYPARDDFDDGELALLEAIAALAGVAVGNARLHEHTRRLARLRGVLAEAAAELAPPLERAEIAQRLADAMHELLGAEVVGIGLMDRAGLLRPLLVTGSAQLPEPQPLGRVPTRIVERVSETWQRGATRACELGADPWLLSMLGGAGTDVARCVLLPLLASGSPVGAVLVGRRQHAPLDEITREAAEMLASLGGSALERCALLARQDRQLRQLEALDRLSQGLSQRADAERLLAHLNELLEEHGMVAVSIAFRDRRLRRHLGGSEPTDPERELWRTSPDEPQWLDDGTCALPMRVGRRLVGTLRLTPAALDHHQRAFASAMASATAEVATRSALHGQVARVERNQELAAERERVAEELRRTVGRIFAGMRRGASALADELAARPALQADAVDLARMADAGSFQLEQAVRAIDHVPSGRRSLVGSLRGLAEAVEEASGISVVVDVDGRPARLVAAIERTLYRVAYEALSMLWRHGRCDFVRLALTFADDEVTLTVLDDGVGLKARHTGPVTGEGLMAIRGELTPVGGSLEVDEMQPHGLRLRVAVPRVGPEPPQPQQWRDPPSPYGLTPRELQVVELVVDGIDNRAIAEVLDISPHTVASHVTSVLRKLRVANRRAVAKKAEAEGLLGSGPRWVGGG